MLYYSIKLLTSLIKVYYGSANYLSLIFALSRPPIPPAECCPFLSTIENLSIHLCIINITQLNYLAVSLQCTTTRALLTRRVSFLLFPGSKTPNITKFCLFLSIFFHQNVGTMDKKIVTSPP